MLKLVYDVIMKTEQLTPGFVSIHARTTTYKYKKYSLLIGRIK